MQELKPTEIKPIPKVFRRNILLICIFTTLFQPLYFPFFLYARRKALQDEMKFPRYWFQLILPIIGVAVSIVTFGVFYIVETVPKIRLLNSGELSFENVTLALDYHHSIFGIMSQIGYIVALLCFVVAVIDMLAMMYDMLTRLKIKFPKYVHYTPHVFTGVGFLYILSEVMMLSYPADSMLPSFFILVQIIFVVSVVLVHMYIVNVYMVMRAVHIKKGELR